MYLGRIYRDYKRPAGETKHATDLHEIMQWLCERINSSNGGKCNRATLIDLKSRTAILIWDIGPDGRPQNPSMPSWGKA